MSAAVPTDYRRDRVAWAEQQGRLLRERRLDAIDRANIAAEIEQVGKGDMDALRERVRILLTALLRWAYQVDLRSTALASTIMAQRQEIQRILKDSASLQPAMDDLVVDTYPEAKRLAVMESGLFDESFPEGLPFLPVEIFDLEFLPDPYGDDKIRGEGWWRGKGRTEAKDH
jgi:hypothetical protein